MISVIEKSFGVNTAATPGARSVAASPSGMIPPTTTGTSPSPGGAQPGDDGRDGLPVRPRQDRQADDVHVLLDRGGDDLRRRQPDALVDDLEADVAGAYRDLLGAVGVSVQPGLADQQSQPHAELGAGARGPARARRRSPRPPRRRRRPPDTPVGARYSPNTSRSAPAHSPVVTPPWRRPPWRPSGCRRSWPRRAAPAAPRRRRQRRGRPASACTASTACRLHSRIDSQDAAVDAVEQRVGLGGRVGVDPHHDVVTGLDPLPALACDDTSADFM